MATSSSLRIIFKRALLKNKQVQEKKIQISHLFNVLFISSILPVLVEEVTLILMDTVNSVLVQKDKFYSSVTSEVLLLWLAIWIEMGLTKKSNVKDHWNRKWGNSLITELMGRDHWLAIFCAL